MPVLWIIAAARIASIRSAVSLVAKPSVPSATVMPASSSARTGQVPLPSFMLDSGLCTTAHPRSAILVISLAVSQMPWTRVVRGVSRPRPSMKATAVIPQAASAWTACSLVSKVWQWIGMSWAADRPRIASSNAGVQRCGPHGARMIRMRPPSWPCQRANWVSNSASWSPASAPPMAASSSWMPGGMISFAQGRHSTSGWSHMSTLTQARMPASS